MKRAMTVRAKLVLFGVCVAGIAVAASATEIWSSDRAAQHQLGSRRDHEELEQLARVESALIWQMKLLDDAADEGLGPDQQRRLDELTLANTRVQLALAAFGGEDSPAGQVGNAEDRREAWEHHPELVDRVTDLAGGVDDVMARIRRGETRPSVAALDIGFRATLAWLTSKVAEEREEAVEQDEAATLWADRANAVTWTAPLISSLILMVAVFLVLRSISRPLRDLESAAARVAGGDLDVPVPVRSSDELGKLAAAFNDMQLSVRARIAERDLALHDARFRGLSEAAPIAIAEIDQRGHPVYANLRWAGLTGGPAQDRPWREMVDEDDRERAERLESERDGSAAELRLKVGHATVWVVAQVAAMDGEDGDRAIVALADITSQKNAVARAEELGRELMEVSRQAGMAEISAGVLHNVGNVLNSIIVSATVVKEQLTRSRVGNLVKATRLLEEHMADLPAFLSTERGRVLPPYLVEAAANLAASLEATQGDLVRIEKGTEHIRAIIMTQQSYARHRAPAEALLLSDVIADVLTMNETSFDRHHLRIVKRYEADPIVVSDRHRIMQILVNLLSNARQAFGEDRGIDPPPVVEISTHMTADGKLALVVADNGVGISPENLARIFEHGFTTRKTGHGFGLHSSAQAARDLGGELSFTSDGLGKGTSFTLTLPVATDTSTDLPPAMEPARPSASPPS
jgi:PAS domain S-box-containing protein